jgi:hypothetical protein
MAAGDLSNSEEESIFKKFSQLPAVFMSEYL